VINDAEQCEMYYGLGLVAVRMLPLFSKGFLEPGRNKFVDIMAGRLAFPRLLTGRARGPAFVGGVTIA
jgi:hypothetical protein